MLKNRSILRRLLGQAVGRIPYLFHELGTKNVPVAPSVDPIEIFLGDRPCDHDAFVRLVQHLRACLGPLPKGALMSVTGASGNCNWIGATFMGQNGCAHYLRRERDIDAKTVTTILAWWDATGLVNETRWR